MRFLSDQCSASRGVGGSGNVDCENEVNKAVYKWRAVTGLPIEKAM
jgi:hypothetical protein